MQYAIVMRVDQGIIVSAQRDAHVEARRSVRPRHRSVAPTRQHNAFEPRTGEARCLPFTKNAAVAVGAKPQVMRRFERHGDFIEELAARLAEVDVELAVHAQSIDLARGDSRETRNDPHDLGVVEPARKLSISGQLAVPSGQIT